MSCLWLCPPPPKKKIWVTDRLLEDTNFTAVLDSSIPLSLAHVVKGCPSTTSGPSSDNPSGVRSSTVSPIS